MYPSHGLQSFRSGLYQVQYPVGSQFLPENLLQCVLLSLDCISFPARSLLQHEFSNSFWGTFTCRAIGSSMIFMDICSTEILHVLQGTICFAMVFSLGCWGTFAPAPGAPLFLLCWSWYLLLLSHLLTAAAQLSYRHFPRAVTSTADGLGSGWLELDLSDKGQQLTEDLPNSFLPTKAMPCKL